MGQEETRPRLEIARELQGGIGDIGLRGELDLATVGELESTFSQLLAERPAAIVVDLSELEFIDSTGIKTLLQLERRCGAGDVTFAVTEGTEPVSRLFALTQLDQHFRVFADRSAARAALA